MNKKMKQLLESVIDSIVEGDSIAAKESFHDYLRAKTQSILLGEAEDEKECAKCHKMECECEDDKEEKAEDEKAVDKSLDKVEDDVKKAKKVQDKDEKDSK